MIEKKLRSFSYAYTGFVTAFKEEFNFRMHITLGLTALFLGFFFRITTIEWVEILLCISVVLAAELFNTALEELCDMLKPTHDPHVAKIKDLSAAAVFVSACAATIIGLMIFWPRVFGL